MLIDIRGLWKPRLMFPELTDLEFQNLMHYSYGTSVDCIADIMKCSTSAVKQSLQRTRIKLNIEKLDSLRGVYNARILTALISHNEFPANYFETMQKQQYLKGAINYTCEQ